MKTTSKKEFTPIVYGETSVKTAHFKFDANASGFSQHWHDRIELHLVKSGTLELICNNEKIRLKKGELSIISPAFSHGGGAGDTGVEYYVLMFDIKDLYNGTVSSLKYLDPIINGEICFKYKTDIPQIVELAEEIIEMNTNTKENHSLEIVGSLYRLLGLLCRFCTDDRISLEHHTAEKFESVISYIKSNFRKEISVDSISKNFSYEKSYFCRKFKSVTGITASKYINIQRLEYARGLLENTNKSIMNIALSSGFSESAYFINCFKKMYGITPLKYREKNRKKNRN
ncbi:MAG: helix-turn-helix transcriptional regulator [Clostridia bacterium]|nr:helix-turn-helix transcriptional regulator [Clostridia bacterium]